MVGDHGGDHGAGRTLDSAGMTTTDHARDQSVTRVTVEIDGDRVAIVVDDDQLRVAVPEVQRRTAWFEEVMGAQAVVRADRRSVG